MAKKGQKFIMLSDELRNEILKKYLNNEESPATLSKKYNISVNSIWSIIKKYKRTGNVKSEPKGRRKEESIDYKERYEILKNYQTFLKAQRGRK